MFNKYDMYSIQDNNIYLITELKQKQGLVIIKLLVFGERESYKLDLTEKGSNISSLVVSIHLSI